MTTDIALEALVRIKAVLIRHHRPCSTLSKHDALVEISAIVDAAAHVIAGDITASAHNQQEQA